MPPVFANTLVTGLAGYGALGLVFAIVFVVAGVQRVDERAAGAGWGFRLLILPGSAALWPLLVLCWVRAGSTTQ